MDDFERQLQSVPLRRPSPDLRFKIFGSPPRFSLANWFRQPVQLQWAMAFSILMAILGYLFATVNLNQPQVISPHITYEIKVTQPESSRPDFDLTNDSNSFLSGNLTVDVNNKMEL